MIDCIYLKEDGCEIIQNLIGVDCPGIIPHPKACEVCISSDSPKDENHVTVNLAMSQCSKCDDCEILEELFDKNNQNLIKYDMVPSTKLVLGEGCGTELHKIYNEMGFSITESCDCIRIIRLMNKWTTEECRENVDEIVTMTKNSAKLHSWLGSLAQAVVPNRMIKKLTLQAITNYEEILHKER